MSDIARKACRRIAGTAAMGCHVKDAAQLQLAIMEVGKAKSAESERQNYGISAHECCMSTDSPHSIT